MYCKDKISVVIPVYNQAHYLKEALDSVVMQNYGSIEIIVVDDGSEDDVESVVKLYQDIDIRYMKQVHAGAAAARNKGVEQSTGEYIAFLDSDDVWLKNKLILQKQMMSEFLLEGVFAHRIQFAVNNANHEYRKEKESGECASSLLIKKSAFLEVGYFSTEYRIGEFLDWYLRSKGQINLGIHEEVLWSRRVHTNNTSKRLEAYRGDYLKIIYKHEKKKSAAN